MKKKKLIALIVPALVIVIIDQVTKHVVRITPSLHNWDIIPGWLSFHYTQNPGMALGMDWASTPVISAIAITATVGIVIYIVRSLDNANIGYLLCMGLVLGGAFGNIIDRLIMGYIGSYGGVLEGHVIDFIHFTLRIDGYPVFPYIFNVADISISVSIIALLLFHQRILPYDENEEQDEAEKQTFDDQKFDSPYLTHGVSGKTGKSKIDAVTREDNTSLDDPVSSDEDARNTEPFDFEGPSDSKSEEENEQSIKFPKVNTELNKKKDQDELSSSPTPSPSPEDTDGEKDQGEGEANKNQGKRQLITFSLLYLSLPIENRQISSALLKINRQ
ncbi:MAG: signal peptidase II [Balneolaceae bacterium]|nr:signal peptidase II [Balneolaceae bacterium]